MLREKTTVEQMVGVFGQSILCRGGLGVAHLLASRRDVNRPIFDRHKRQVAWDADHPFCGHFYTYLGRCRNKPQNQIERLLAGPRGVYMCNECLDCCQQTIQRVSDPHPLGEANPMSCLNKGVSWLSEEHGTSPFRLTKRDLLTMQPTLEPGTSLLVHPKPQGGAPTSQVHLL